MSPVAERELRLAARDPKTYWARRITALLVLLCCVLMFWLMNQLGGTGLTGRDVFHGISTSLLVIYVFAGVNLTADCLSEEKREGTLGLLLLTDLKGRDIVLGKLLSSSLKTFCGFLAAFPVLAVTFTLGGIKLSEFWKIMLNLSASLGLALSVGLFVSSVSRRNRAALSAATSTMSAVMFVFPALSELLRRNGYSLELAGVLQFLSPFNTHFMAFETSSALRLNFFWWSLLTTVLLSLGLLALACVLLPRCWQDQPIRAGMFGKGWRGGWQRIKLGSLQSRLHLRNRLLERNPFYWLAARERFAMLPLWIFIGVVAVTMGGVWLRYSASNPNVVVPACVICIMMLTLAVLLNFTTTACQRLTEDRHSGTLEVLISTPLPVKAMLRGQWLALGRQLTGPMLAVIAINALAYGAARVAAGANGEQIFSVRVLLIGAAIVAANLIALGWTAMWMALRVKQANHASGAAFWRIMLLPWPIVVFLLQLAFWARSSSYLETNLPYLIPMIVGGVPILNGVFWSIWCRAKLYREFRLAATDRFQPPKPSQSWWKLPGALIALLRERIAVRPARSPDATAP